MMRLVVGRALILLLPLSAVTGASADVVEIAKEELSLMKSGLPAYKTVSADQLSDDQRRAVGRVFEVAPETISKFRWGPVMALPGSPNAGASFVTLWHGIGTAQTEVTLRFSPSGDLLNRAGAPEPGPGATQGGQTAPQPTAVAVSKSGMGDGKNAAATGHPSVEISTSGADFAKSAPLSCEKLH